MNTTNVQQTSIESYHSLKDISARQSQVYHALKGLGSACNAEIATTLELPINVVVPRLFELRSKGLVEEAYRNTYIPTGKRVIYWRVVR